MSYNFKEGDKIRMKSTCSDCYVDQVYSLVDYEGSLTVNGPKFPYSACQCRGEWELIKDKRNIMTNLLSKFKNMNLGEPDKSFLKVGVTDDKGDVTEEGKSVFNQFLFDKYKDEFNEKVVQPLLEADKELDKE